MENNQFTEQQLIFLYNDAKFLEFLSNYFSSYNVKDIMLHGGMNESQKECSWKIFIRILMANVSTILEAIQKIEKNISFSYEECNVTSTGEIKGRLLVDKYVQNKSMVRLPKTYPCIVKEKTFDTPENQYIVYIVHNVALRLSELLAMAEKELALNGEETEIRLLKENLDYFMYISKKYPFNSISADSIRAELFPNDKLSTIRIRLSKGKIRNAHAYKVVFEWYEKFMKYNFSWVDHDNIRFLIYDEQFTNKLFEIWCLYKIINKYQTSFDMVVVEENALSVGLNDFVCKLKSLDGDYIEVYYQMGSGLYWDSTHKQNWHYVNKDKDLIGIPDISIKYKGATENLTLVDLKNRVRKGGDNSEEIYKVIGYFANFGSFLREKYNREYRNQAVLIFRNDEGSFIEKLESDSGESIMALSVAVSDSIENCENQFKEICRYVLDLQGISGTKCETISDCNHNINEQYLKLKDAFNSEDEQLQNDIMYQLEETNHKIISSMFSKDELKSVLDRKKKELQENHFPHIWEKISSKTIEALAMADCLFNGLTDCEGADYAPVCLEFCRALEIELNDLIFTPFRNSRNIASLAVANWNYRKMESERELTLGECLFMLRKCTVAAYPTTELYSFIKSNIKQHKVLFESVIDIMEGINVDIRRKAAHTSLMSYGELVDSRQKIMGIGNVNLLYILLDNR